MEDDNIQEQRDQQAHEAENIQPGDTGAPEGEIIPEKTGQGRTDNERLDDAALKFMADAAYAVAGFAGLVGEKARAFYDEQRAEYAKTHPDVESPGAREFLEQLGSQLNRFVDEIGRSFRELSDKGREVMNTTGSGTPEDAGKTENTPVEETDPEKPHAEEPNGEEYGEEYTQPENK